MHPVLEKYAETWQEWETEELEIGTTLAGGAILHLSAFVSGTCAHYGCNAMRSVQSAL
jgi:hypothetical protein